MGNRLMQISGALSDVVLNAVVATFVFQIGGWAKEFSMVSMGHYKENKHYVLKDSGPILVMNDYLKCCNMLFFTPVLLTFVLYYLPIMW